MNGTVSSRELSIVAAPAAAARTSAAGLGLQLAGLYAAAITFGIWVTAALCGVGALAVLLQHVVLWRVNTCSPGE